MDFGKIIQLQQRLYEVVKSIYAPSPSEASRERETWPGFFDLNGDVAQDRRFEATKGEVLAHGYSTANVFATVRIDSDEQPDQNLSFTLELMAANNGPPVPAGFTVLQSPTGGPGVYELPVVIVHDLLANSCALRLRVDGGPQQNATRRVRGRVTFNVVLGRTY